MKILETVSYNIGAELLQLVCMFLSISHWPVGFKGTMEKQRGQLRYIGGNPSPKERILSPRA
jgi:hypothetical protein